MRTGPFRHGVASGEPSLSSLALWTRVSSSEAEVPLHWVVEPADPTSTAARQSGDATASFCDDHTVTVPVSGLSPSTRYRFHFESEHGELSPHGLAATLPAHASRFRIGFVCCSRYGLGYFTAYRMLAEEGCDLVVHLGDYTYQDATVWIPERQPDPGYESRTLGDYRRRLAQHRRDPDLQALHHAAPMVALWDDHDVTDDVRGYEGVAATQRRRDGQRAWREWLPVLPGDGGIDRVVSVPGLVDLIALDARYTGRVPHRRRGPWTEPRRRLPMLSESQWPWLERSLEASSAPWKVITNQVQVGPMHLAAVPSITSGRSVRRPIVNPDQWDGYPDERRRLYELVRDHAASLLVSGDLHSTWYRQLRDDEGRHVSPELTVSSVAGESFADAFGRLTRLPAGLLDRVIRSKNDGIEYLDLARHGYALVDVARDRVDVTAVLLDTALERMTAVERVHLATIRGR